MTAKAVFVSQTLGVYVTGEELRLLREDGAVLCDLWLGKQRAPGSMVWLRLEPYALDTLSRAYDAERAAIDAGLAKLPPRPDTRAADRRRKRERLHD